MIFFLLFASFILFSGLNSVLFAVRLVIERNHNQSNQSDVKTGTKCAIERERCEKQRTNVGSLVSLSHKFIVGRSSIKKLKSIFIGNTKTAKGTKWKKNTEICSEFVFSQLFFVRFFVWVFSASFAFGTRNVFFKDYHYVVKSKEKTIKFTLCRCESKILRTAVTLNARNNAQAHRLYKTVKNERKKNKNMRNLLAWTLLNRKYKIKQKTHKKHDNKMKRNPSTRYILFSNHKNLTKWACECANESS